jgi:hypothetical protein
MCWDFVRTIFCTSVWLQAGQYLALALAAQIPAKQKSGCPRLLRWQDYAEAEAPTAAKQKAGYGVIFFSGTSRLAGTHPGHVLVEISNQQVCSH